MSRRAIVLVLIGLALGITGWWLTRNFGFTTQRVFVGYSGEARQDAYFAARLFLEGMGKQVARQAMLRSADTLPPGATVVLQGSRANLDPPLVRGLLAWVEGGGRLIVGAEWAWAKDPLLDALGVAVESAEEPEPDDRQFEAVTLGDGTRLRAALQRSVLLRHEGPAAWRHTGPQGDRILVLQHGRGRVVVFSTLSLFNNGGLEQFDHAPLLWHFVERTGPQVVLVRQLERTSLAGWLDRHARPALAALAGLILLWLWRVVPRFGPLRPHQAPERRGLVEHLRAVGRYHAQQRQLGVLLQRVRDDAQAVFARSAPLAASLDGAGRLREASRLTRLRPRELMQAFTAAATTRHEFANAVRTLAAFRRRLASGANRDDNR